MSLDCAIYRIIIRAIASPITTVVKWVLARQSDGMIEASATRRPEMPFTVPSGLTTPSGSLTPLMRQLPAACWISPVTCCNSASSFPTITSISGSATFCVGIETTPLAIDTGALNEILVLSGFYGSPEDVARKNAMDFARTIDRTAVLMAAASDVTQQAVDISAALDVDPTINTVFPDTDLGQQLLQVAKIIKLNQTSLNLSRQIFYVETGGYDTHQDQASDQGNNFLDLSQALGAFYAALVELGVQDSVAAFTHSVR